MSRDSRGPCVLEAVDYGWFDGILRGKLDTDGHEIRAGVDALNALGVARADLEIEGGTFSILMDETTVSGNRLGSDQANGFVAGVQRLIDVSGQPNTVESTLRCTMVAGDTVQETLFGVSDGRLHPVSQSRAIEDRDRKRAPRVPAGPGFGDLGRGKALALIAAFVVLFGLLAWKNGYIDRLLTASAETISLETGSFGAMLELGVSGNWGNYAVVVSRGTAYPQDARAVDRLLSRAVSSADRAAVNAVGDGGTVWVQLQDAQGKVLASAKVSLRSLLSDPERKAEASLPGRIGARKIVLSLDSGAGKK